MTMDKKLVEQVGAAIHGHLSRRDIMQYLDNPEDCYGLATAIIPIIAEYCAGLAEAPRKGTVNAWRAREIIATAIRQAGGGA